MRTPLFIPYTKPIGELFGEMQRAKAQMAIVLDEYGGTSGMVTIEELIEEIVGSVSDELATSVPQLRRTEDGQIEADARMSVDEANAQLGIELPESDDYETLAGLILTRMGRVPKSGEVVRIGGIKLTVYKMEGPRIIKIHLSKAGDKSKKEHTPPTHS
jgi:putative hemolysin